MTVKAIIVADSEKSVVNVLSISVKDPSATGGAAETSYQTPATVS
jgi:hypothetical protein